MAYIEASKAGNFFTHQVKLYGQDDFRSMYKVGRLAAQCLDMLSSYVKEGTSTETLDQMAYEFARDHNATPAPLYYRGFPKSICTSINHVVCHGIPSSRILQEGDIVNIDITLILDSYHGDTSRMFAIGDVGMKAKNLMDTTYLAMMKGIEAVRSGACLGDVGAAIEQVAKQNRCAIVEEFCGHGLGRVFHDSPNVLHYGQKGQGLQLREGMIFTIEPMLNAGKAAVKILQDGWTAVTRDRSLSAQFEHSIGVTKQGCEIFTSSPQNLHTPHNIE